MKNIFLLISFIILIPFLTYAQQLPYTSQLNTTRALWNPAATATGTEMQNNLLMRQQWIGFSNAPRTGSANIEYPLIDYNMSAGAALNFDKSGPVSKIGLQLNYAYKLKGIFTRTGQLSAGISASLSQFTFNPSNTIVNEEDDPIYLDARSSSFFPTASAGIFYTTNPKMYDGGNIFFFGLSYGQVYAGNVLVNDRLQDRYNHIFFEIGTRIQGRDSYLEPSITFNYTNPELSTIIVGAKFELKDAFWAGIGYSSASDISIQGGVSYLRQDQDMPTLDLELWPIMAYQTLLQSLD